MAMLKKARVTVFLVIVFAALVTGVPRAHPQDQMLNADAPSDSASAQGESPSSDMALPADRIIELLRAKPDLLVEVKKVAAERLQAQGVDVQEESITDERLFSRIIFGCEASAPI